MSSISLSSQDCDAGPSSQHGAILPGSLHKPSETLDSSATVRQPEPLKMELPGRKTVALVYRPFGPLDQDLGEIIRLCDQELSEP